MRQLDGITDSMVMSLTKLEYIVKNEEAWHATSMGSQGVGRDLATEWQHQLQSNFYEWYDFFLLFLSFTKVSQAGEKKIYA